MRWWQGVRCFFIPSWVPFFSSTRAASILPFSNRRHERKRFFPASLSSLLWRFERVRDERPDNTILGDQPLWRLSRCRRQSVRVDEYKPSRRRIAPHGESKTDGRSTFIDVSLFGNVSF
jgi:hypothetical protein